MNTNRSISQLRSSLKTLKQPAACWASTSLSASLSSLFQTLRLCPKKKDHMMRHVKQILIYSKTRQWLEKVSMFMSEDPDPWILFSPLWSVTWVYGQRQISTDSLPNSPPRHSLLCITQCNKCVSVQDVLSLRSERKAMSQLSFWLQESKIWQTLSALEGTHLVG